jgi:hypothetical protein
MSYAINLFSPKPPLKSFLAETNFLPGFCNGKKVENEPAMAFLFCLGG